MRENLHIIVKVKNDFGKFIDEEFASINKSHKILLWIFPEKSRKNFNCLILRSHTYKAVSQLLTYFVLSYQQHAKVMIASTDKTAENTRKNLLKYTRVSSLKYFKMFSLFDYFYYKNFN